MVKAPVGSFLPRRLFKPDIIIEPYMDSVNGSDTTFCVIPDKYNFNKLDIIESALECVYNRLVLGSELLDAFLKEYRSDA